MGWTYGIDMGGTTVKTAVISETGEIVEKAIVPTMAERGAADLVSRLYTVMQESCGRAGISVEDVLGVGVGVPGFLNDDQSTIVEAVNLGWKDVPLKAELDRVFGKPVFIENDANVASLGEAWVGAGQGRTNVLCVTLGTGIGGGIVIDGKLMRGANGMAGEIGHIVVKREHGALCNCGHRGCLETLASATGIVRIAREKQNQGAIAAGIDIQDAETVFRLAADGSVGACQAVSEAADWLGYGLAMVCNVLNPDCIVIGGGVSKAGDRLMEPVRESFQNYALKRVQAAAALEFARLGNDAGVIGAARLVFHGAA